jgi:hypothetical protein
MAPPRRGKIINARRTQRRSGAGAMSKTIGKTPNLKLGEKGSIIRKQIELRKKG